MGVCVGESQLKHKQMKLINDTCQRKIGYKITYHIISANTEGNVKAVLSDMFRHILKKKVIAALGL